MDTVYLTVLGLNHNTAPVEIREKIFVHESDIPGLLDRMKQKGIDESVILSTCNRTEVYFHSTLSQQEALKNIQEILIQTMGVQPDWFHDFMYVFRNEDVYKHLFLVASGLDSLVIGEPEILGQVKDAYRIATFSNTTGFFLNKVFHKTFNVAKKIRTETRIGYNPLSISSMAIELAKKIFGNLDEKKILVIGAGEMCQTALKYFKKEGLKEILITNRTYEKAHYLAEEITGTAYPFQELPELIAKVDVVLTSTGSERPFIDKPLIQGIMKKRKNRAIFIIDIAVPRDVASEVNAMENVYLYDIDDLRELSQQHLTDRLKESDKARLIVQQEAAEFTKVLQELDVAPLIAHIVGKVEEIRLKEVRKALRKLKNADQDTVRTIEVLTRTIANKVVHPHITLIKENGSEAIVEILKKCFQFEEIDEEEMDNRDEGK